MNPTRYRLSDSWWWRRQVYVSVAITAALLLLTLWSSLSPAAPLTDEGVRLLSKGAIVLVALVVAAFARTVVGRNPKRHIRMAMGTVGGVASGVAAAPTLSAWVGVDVSSLSALCGVFLGWAVAYQFVKHIPRNGPARPTPWHTW